MSSSDSAPWPSSGTDAEEVPGDEEGWATPSFGVLPWLRSAVWAVAWEVDEVASAAAVASEAAGAAASVEGVRAVTGSTKRLTRHQHRRIVRSVEEAERTTGLQFCVYLGPTTDDPRAHAEALFVEAGLHTRPAILLLVSPEARRVELVTSAEVRDRVSDQTCANAIAEMTRFFARSDVAGGIVAGTHMLQTAIGTASADPSLAAFPDIIEG